MTIQELFKTAIDRKASDIHFAVGRAPFLRIDGVLQELTDLSVLDAKTVETLVFSTLTKELKDRFEDERELDYSYEVDGTRFRVNIHYERGYVGLVARIINSRIPSFAELGIPPVMEKLTELENGLILVTGPTGSGKSTLLAAMLERINTTESSHIVTFEDPVEYAFASKKSIIKQRQLGTDMRTFAAGLKHVLRQDPDVIMIGEMRDLETIAAALTIAETGHLVFATLHTYNAAQTIDRIVDVFPPHQQQQIRLQLSSTLRAVISQRLLPKVGGGRIGTREVLIANHAVANLIREAKTSQVRTVIQTGADAGMVTFDQDINRLFKEGLIDRATAEAQLSGEMELSG